MSANGQGNTNAATGGENPAHYQVWTIVDANNNTKIGYGATAMRNGTVRKVRIITSITGTGTRTDSTVIVKKNTTVVATLTSDVASVGAGGTAQLTLGSNFSATLSTVAGALDFVVGDKFTIETTTANASDTIEDHTFAQIEVSDPPSS